MYGTVHFYLKNKNVQYCTLKKCGAYIVVLPRFTIETAPKLVKF